MARGRSMHLTPREFELLCYLVAHPNRVIRHREILQAVWGPDSGDDVEALRVVVNQLRKKIEVQPSKPVYLLTEPWAGYRLCLPSDDVDAGKKPSAANRPRSADRTRCRRRIFAAPAFAKMRAAIREQS